jgi:hypothetical protein
MAGRKPNRNKPAARISTDNGAKFGRTLNLVTNRTIISGETAEEAKTSN